MSWLSIVTVVFIMFAHWFADFVLQTDEQAKGKSTSNKYLLDHVSSYTAAMTILVFSFVTVICRCHLHLWQFLGFLGITFSAHFITDYFTSRLNSYLWKKQRVHDFFVSVGFDQMLHYLQLLLTYKLLF